MFTKFKLLLAGIVAIAGAILVAFLKGRSSGKEEVQEEVREQEIKNVEAVANRRVETAHKVQKVQQTVIASDDKSVDDELLKGWTRPPNIK